MSLVQAVDVAIVTGSSGFIGSALVKRLAQRYRVIGFDREVPPHPPAEAECVCIDLTDESSVQAAFRLVRNRPNLVGCRSRISVRRNR